MSREEKARRAVSAIKETFGVFFGKYLPFAVRRRKERRRLHKTFIFLYAQLVWYIFASFFYSLTMIFSLARFFVVATFSYLKRSLYQFLISAFSRYKREQRSIEWIQLFSQFALYFKNFVLRHPLRIQFIGMSEFVTVTQFIDEVTYIVFIRHKTAD